MNAEELLRSPARDRAELVRGVLRVSEPPGARHGQIATRLAARLHTFVEARRLGTVLVEAGFTLRRSPDTVRGPDVSFVCAQRLDPDQVPAGFLPFAPDLVVEIASPGDRDEDLAAKVSDYLEAGARLVWVIDPAGPTATVHRADRSTTRFGARDILSGENVVPGFSCAIGWLTGEG